MPVLRRLLELVGVRRSSVGEDVGAEAARGGKTGRFGHAPVAICWKRLLSFTAISKTTARRPIEASVSTAYSSK
jgi:hypothetical protein